MCQETSAQAGRGVVFLAGHVLLERGPINSALLDFETGRVLSLNPAAGRIARRLERGESFDQIRSGLAPAQHEACARFLDSLWRHGVLTRSPSRAHPRLKATREARALKGGLRFMWVELTEACNLRCLHCYAEASARSAPAAFRRRRGLDASRVRSLIRDAIELGCERIQLTGGEPTLRAELAEIIEFAMEQGLKRLEVFSNGTRISDRLMDLFSRYGVCLAVSFYSCNEHTHDAITGVEGSCRATLETLERARHRGINVRVGLPVMRRNEGDIQKTRAFLRDNDLCKEIRVDAIRPVGRGLDPALNPAEYDPVRSRPNFRASWETYVKSLAGNSCWFGKLAVTSTGDVLPCVFARNDALGNITRQSLRDVVHSARTQSRWRLTADQIETCGACEFRHVCRDCRVLAAGEEGDLYRRRGRCGYDPHRGTWS